MEYRYQLWDLPKGHIEQNEDAQSAAVREVLEETNVKANIINYQNQISLQLILKVYMKRFD